MKFKIYTLTTLCLFFMTRTTAQGISSPSEIRNQIDLTLLVEDGPSRQEFRLQAEDNHDVYHEIDMINYYISLAYQSSEDTTSYFALRCTFETLTDADGIPLVQPLMTATAPVIIPPVKKKKSEIQRAKLDYPYIATIPYRIHPRRYKVTIELLKFETYEDYIAVNNNHTVSATKIIYLDATHRISSERTAIVTTYPNPTLDHLTITYTSENAVPSTARTEVTIYNDKGIQVSQHSLVNTSTDIHKPSYTLDTSHLQRGTYYVQIMSEGKTQTKTILKE